jgi:hypothetical protein
MGVLSLLVKLGVDSTNFEMGIKRAQSMGEKFGASFKSAVTSRLTGALSIAAVTGFAHSIVKAADDISDLSEQLNVSTDDIQRLQILAGETGVSFEKLASVLAKFEQVRLKATSGDEDAIKTLSALGLSLDQLRDPQMDTIAGAVKAATAYKESGRSAETTAAMIDVFGIKLKTAAAAFADFQTTADKGLISKDNIRDLAKANVELEEAIRQLKVLSAPTAAKATGYFAGFIENYNEMIGMADFAKGKKTYYNIGGLDLSSAASFLAKTFAGPGSVIPSLFGIRLKKQKGGAAAASEQGPPPIGDPQFEQVRSRMFSLGGSQDSLARIGGFTGFQRGQDTAIKQAIEQTIQLKLIVANTGKTAQKLSQE